MLLDAKNINTQVLQLLEQVDLFDLPSEAMGVPRSDFNSSGLIGTFYKLIVKGIKGASIS